MWTLTLPRCTGSRLLPRASIGVLAFGDGVLEFPRGSGNMDCAPANGAFFFGGGVGAPDEEAEVEEFAAEGDDGCCCCRKTWKTGWAPGGRTTPFGFGAAGGARGLLLVLLVLLPPFDVPKLSKCKDTVKTISVVLYIKTYRINTEERRVAEIFDYFRT